MTSAAVRTPALASVGSRSQVSTLLTGLQEYSRGGTGSGMHHSSSFFWVSLIFLGHFCLFNSSIARLSSSYISPVPAMLTFMLYCTYHVKLKTYFSAFQQIQLLAIFSCEAVGRIQTSSCSLYWAPALPTELNDAPYMHLCI